MTWATSDPFNIGNKIFSISESNSKMRIISGKPEPKLGNIFKILFLPQSKKKQMFSSYENLVSFFDF